MEIEANFYVQKNLVLLYLKKQTSVIKLLHLKNSLTSVWNLWRVSFFSISSNVRKSAWYFPVSNAFQQWSAVLCALLKQIRIVLLSSEKVCVNKS